MNIRPSVSRLGYCQLVRVIQVGILLLGLNGCSKPPEQPPKDVIDRAVRNADPCGLASTLKSYKIRNYYTRTIEGEVWHVYDVTTECEMSQDPHWTRQDQAMVKCVKRGEMWYSETEKRPE